MCISAHAKEDFFCLHVQVYPFRIKRERAETHLACLQGKRVLEEHSEDGGSQEGVDQEEGHEEGVDREGGRQEGGRREGGHRGEGRQEGESQEEAKGPELLEEVEVFCTWELLVLETYSLKKRAMDSKKIFATQSLNLW